MCSPLAGGAVRLFQSLTLSPNPFLSAPAVISISLSRGFFVVTRRSGFQRCGHQLNPSRDLRGVGVRWVTQHMLSSCTCTSLPDVQGSGYVQIPCSIPALRQYVATIWIRSLFSSPTLSPTPFLRAPAVITTSLSRGFVAVTRRTVFSAVVISSTRF